MTNSSSPPSPRIPSVNKNFAKQMGAVFRKREYDWFIFDSLVQNNLAVGGGNIIMAAF